MTVLRISWSHPLQRTGFALEGRTFPSATSRPHLPTFIPNGAGRLYLPLSLLRKGRPADVRNLSSASEAFMKASIMRMYA